LLNKEMVYTMITRAKQECILCAENSALRYAITQSSIKFKQTFLAELLKNKKKLSYVNLIPYNPVSEHDEYQRSTKEDILAFYDILKKRGVNCVVRQEFGSDIDAACGQLRSKQMKKTK
ncbi:MAG: hypothetical protein RSC33_03420, partial [Vagococcus sp.]